MTQTDVREYPAHWSGTAVRRLSFPPRSEEHTSELQSQPNLVCRLLLEKKNSDEMVTQIVPIRYANATQMIIDVQQRLLDYATFNANESANAHVLTDMQADTRRIVEIVR